MRLEGHYEGFGCRRKNTNGNSGIPRTAVTIHLEEKSGVLYRIFAHSVMDKTSKYSVTIIFILSATWKNYLQKVTESVIVIGRR